MRFGYDGSGFAGWARQPGLRTVEGEIRRGIARAAIATAEARLEVASRTDRGVSARANALTLATALDGPALLHRLNGIAPDLVFSAATVVPSSFRVRAARRRIYRYYEPGPPGGFDRYARAARRFVGAIDVRSFGRAIPSDAPVVRTVESVTVRPIPGGAIVEVRAPSFVWGMVRKIVAALREHDAGRLPLGRLDAALRGRARLALPLAEAERLVLWSVDYPRRWTVRWDGPSRYQARRLAAAGAAAWSRARVVAALRGPAR